MFMSMALKSIKQKSKLLKLMMEDQMHIVWKRANVCSHLRENCSVENRFHLIINLTDNKIIFQNDETKVWFF